MPDLKFLGVCLHELFDNGRYEIDITFLAFLAAHHQLAEREVGRYSVEIPTNQQKFTTQCNHTHHYQGTVKYPEILPDSSRHFYPTYRYMLNSVINMQA